MAAVVALVLALIGSFGAPGMLVERLFAFAGYLGVVLLLADTIISMINRKADRVAANAAFSFRRFLIAYACLLVFLLLNAPLREMASGEDPGRALWVFAFIAPAFMAAWYAWVMHPMMRWVLLRS